MILNFLLCFPGAQALFTLPFSCCRFQAALISCCLDIQLFATIQYVPACSSEELKQCAAQPSPFLQWQGLWPYTTGAQLGVLWQLPRTGGTQKAMQFTGSSGRYFWILIQVKKQSGPMPLRMALYHLHPSSSRICFKLNRVSAETDKNQARTQSSQHSHKSLSLL